MGALRVLTCQVITDFEGNQEAAPGAWSPTACCGSCSFHSNIQNSIDSILIWYIDFPLIPIVTRPQPLARLFHQTLPDGISMTIIDLLPNSSNRAAIVIVTSALPENPPDVHSGRRRLAEPLPGRSRLDLTDYQSELHAVGWM